MNHESVYQKKLENLRKEIDKLDSKILKLLNKRFEIVHQVGFLKKEHSKEICDPKREETILQRLAAENQKIHGKLTAESIRSIYTAIQSCAKHAEKFLQQS